MQPCTAADATSTPNAAANGGAATAGAARERNVAAVHAFYAAINSGDAEALLAVLAEDVEWDCFSLPTSAQRAGVPWLQGARGKEALRRYQQAVRQAGLDAGKLEAWVPKQVVAEGDTLFTMSETTIASKITGKVARMEGAYMFKLNAEGKVTAFRHFVDTGAHVWVHTPDERVAEVWAALGGAEHGKVDGSSDGM
ncbi:hypothetical protein ABPG75_002163 [Micractinium tetrahymenae]